MPAAPDDPHPAEAHGEPVPEGHRAGFVNVIGRPNVGKSTLTNALLGERLSAITAKAQTTRHRILGMLNGPDWQLVFSDTPGIIEAPGYKLQERMNEAVRGAMADADVLLFVTAPDDRWTGEEELLQRLARRDTPVIVVVNKADEHPQDAVAALLGTWSERLPSAEGYPLSALHGLGVDALRERLVALLPEHPPYYPKDLWTDRPERFFVSETVREKILERYRQEVPYSVEVAVESFKEDERLIRVRALIYVNRATQKAILIGQGGRAIKGLGIDARKALETFFAKPIHLELHVKVREGWREKERDLNQFGYPG